MACDTIFQLGGMNFVAVVALSGVHQNINDNFLCQPHWQCSEEEGNRLLILMSFVHTYSILKEAI